MITGDGALTGADVARRLGMVTRPPKETLVLHSSPLEWRSLSAGYDGGPGPGPGASGAGAGGGGGAGPGERTETIPFSGDSVAATARSFDLVVTGSALSAVLADALGGAVAPSPTSSNLTSDPGPGTDARAGTDAQDKAAASKV